jgi:RimJ/RimL family protein N-acetyltransferase
MASADSAQRSSWLARTAHNNQKGEQVLERKTCLTTAGRGDAGLVARLTTQSHEASRVGLRGVMADDEEGIRAAIASGSVSYLVVTTLEGRPIGLIEWRWVGQRVARCAHIGIMISDPELWSLGYGAEAIDNAIEELFYTHDVHRIEFLTAMSNSRVASLLARADGPIIDGILRDYFYADGRFEDAVLWSILRQEFDAASVDVPDRHERRGRREELIGRTSRRIATYLNKEQASTVHLLLQQRHEMTHAAEGEE